MTTLKHDGPLDIAIGRNRKDTAWRNHEMLWSELLMRLSLTHRTAETFASYCSSNKSRRDEIKDVGGFVGGYITGGRRKHGAILHRSLVSLDIDFGNKEIWDDFCLLFNCAGAIYTTHSHSAEKPRLRLIVPLDRPVACDEYVAISRRIAGTLGINYFDDTTFQPERLMYWPSTSSDGEFLFDSVDGLFLSADEMLGSYKDWTNTAEWPVSDRVEAVVRREATKQGDPCEKGGIVGAFCRAYTISEAIEGYLDDVYTACDIPNRYTYREGSTSSGLVVYEDKYAYSHHSTDPIVGKLCNAFDLVRLHLYGLQDEEAQEGTPVNRLPSYIAMCERATKDAKVRNLLGQERLKEAGADFAEQFEEEADMEWLSEMDVDRRGAYRATSANIRLILENDPQLKGALAHDAFRKTDVALKALPWSPLPAPRDLNDTDDAGLRDYLETIYNITGVQKIKDAMQITLSKHQFNPVRDYLEACRWDGVERISTLLIDYLGAEDTPYTRSVAEVCLTAAVARIYQPGIKFDYVPVIVGPQGCGKSSFVRFLGRSWFSDSFGTVSGKEAVEQIQGAWIIEIGELAGLKKADLDVIKHFITKQTDRFRTAYARRVETFPRQCVFWGTTNNHEFLKDPTGNRRFLPIDTGKREPTKSIFADLEREVDQIWAEAVHRYKEGATLHLTAPLEQLAQSEQKQHSERDSRIGMIQEYLNTPIPRWWDQLTISDRILYLQGGGNRDEYAEPRTRVCVAEVWCELFERQRSDLTKGISNEIANMILACEGWERNNVTVRIPLYGAQKGFVNTLISKTDELFTKENVTNDDAPF